jgi:hypothetical protein
VAAAGFGDAVHAIHRMFDERGRIDPAMNLQSVRIIDGDDALDHEGAVKGSSFKQSKLAVM